MKPSSETTLCLLAATMFAACSGISVGDITSAPPSTSALEQYLEIKEPSHPLSPEIRYERIGANCFTLKKEKKQPLILEYCQGITNGSKSKIRVTIPYDYFSVDGPLMIDFINLFVDNNYEAHDGIDFFLLIAENIPCKGAQQSNYYFSSFLSECNCLDNLFSSILSEYFVERHIKYFQNEAGK